MLNIKGTNLTIMVKDMDKSINFYTKVGFTLKNRWGDNFAEVVAPGITVGIHPAGEEFGTNSHMSIGLMVDKLDEAKALLDTNGIQYKTGEDQAGNFLFFNDPDTTPLYFMQMKWG